tara:strand:- start:2352 stop:3374 length:1023 start_codon:yes stop_codon:yes gene_type:complete
MKLTKELINQLFIFWLISSLSLIFILIIVGGLTRLTNSGLSIIEWELFKGILPPFNDTEWNLYFNKYKTIPQYKIINYDMNIEEFKIIFYWEYAHRFLARFIGLFFLLPLIFFYFSKKIKKKYIKICFFIFALILVQGGMGWYMVKSGLVHDITVSHYRLSIHLSIAIIIISSIFWLILNIYKKDKNFFIFSQNNLFYQILLLAIFLQIILGAFVSGLDAGMIYQTWPLMGKSFFPDDIVLNNIFNFFEFNNHSLVQFYHRNLAYFILIFSSFIIFNIFKKKIKKLYYPIKIFSLILSIQVFFGIITLISGLNIYLASLHQITGVLLVFSALNLYYLNAK